MLTQSAIQAAYPLAEILAQKGLLLRPVGETPLSQLINASLLHAEMLAAAPDSALQARPDFHTQIAEASRQTDADGRVLHDEIMQSAVSAISAVITANISTARNVVKPMIVEVAKETQSLIENSVRGATNGFGILDLRYKAIWDSPTLSELVGRFANAPMQDIQLLTLGVSPGTTAQDALKTGSGTFDAQIDAFVTEFGQDNVMLIWDRLFGSNPASTLFNLIPLDRQYADKALITYLFARRAMEDVPPGVNMDLTTWRSYASTVMAQSGRTVARHIERRRVDERNLTLVLSAPVTGDPNGDSITVVGDVYTRWCAAGGTPEILFGSVLSDRQFGYQHLLDNAERYQRVWKKEYSNLQSAVASKRFGYLREGLATAMTRLIETTPEAQLKQPKSVYHALLKEHMARVKPKHLEDIFGISTKLVCRVLFAETDIEKILEGIEVSARNHPELEMREAALLAVNDFVVDWLCKLFKVEYFKDTVSGA